MIINYICIGIIAILSFLMLRRLLAFALERRRINQWRKKHGVPKEYPILMAPLVEDDERRKLLDRVEWKDDKLVFFDDLGPPPEWKDDFGHYVSCKLNRGQPVDDDKYNKLADMAKHDEENNDDA